MIRQDVFERMVWRPDRMELDDSVFRLEHYKNNNWELGDNCFIFYKIKELVNQYARFFSLRRDFAPKRVFELGMWDGGSVALWFEVLQPLKHVAVDITVRKNTPYFDRYVKSHQAQDRIATYWGTDQANSEALGRIVDTEFGDAPIDLVIDDASHFYEQTKASFEALFPRLRPGGLYIIEDWAWAHWPQFLSEQKTWAERTPLTHLVLEVVQATGSSTELIANLTIFQGFVVAERGSGVIDDTKPFRLDEHIAGKVSQTRSSVTVPRRVLRRIRRAMSRTARHVAS